MIISRIRNPWIRRPLVIVIGVPWALACTFVTAAAEAIECCDDLAAAWKAPRA